VTRRFYRGDKSRGTKGVGLGLSLVAAIVKRHDFILVIGEGTAGGIDGGGGLGCVVDIVCRGAWSVSTRDVASVAAPARRLAAE
jgi:hypothetical protein